MEEFQFTKRVHNILKIAAEEGESNIIQPVHLFIGMCKKVLAYAASCICICFVTWGRIFRKTFITKTRRFNGSRV